MNKIAISFSLIGLLTSPNVFAHHATAHKYHPTETASVTTIKVNGMVCDFCAQSAKKVFEKQGSVKDVFIDLNNSTIMITESGETVLSDDIIGSLVKKSGYALVSIDHGLTKK